MSLMFELETWTIFEILLAYLIKRLYIILYTVKPRIRTFWIVISKSIYWLEILTMILFYRKNKVDWNMNWLELHIFSSALIFESKLEKFSIFCQNDPSLDSNI